MIRTYIPVERRPNCDNVALHEIICVMSMKNEWKLSSESKASFDQKPLLPLAGLGSGDWVQGERKIWERLIEIAVVHWNCALFQRFCFLVLEYGTSCNSRGQESVTTWTKEKNCRNVRWCQIKRVGINREQGKYIKGHFTVMDGSEAEGDLVLIQTFLLYYVNQVILMLSSIFQEQFP